jgi:hypothetical protein
MDEEEILFKITDAAEEFIESFISLFHNKKTIFFGISALLVLHPMVDAYVFIIPYAFSTDSFYGELGENHEPLKAHFISEKDSLAYSDQLILYFSYFFNVLAMLMLMFLPAIFWYIIHQGRNESTRSNIPGYLLAFLYFCISFFILIPAFKIESSDLTYVLGADIQTRNIMNPNLATYFYISCTVFIFILILTFLDKVKMTLTYLFSMLGLGFFGVYLYSYFTSIISFYVDFVIGLWSYDFISIYLMSYYILFMILLSIFYVGGYIGFAIEMFSKEW